MVKVSQLKVITKRKLKHAGNKCNTFLPQKKKYIYIYITRELDAKMVVDLVEKDVGNPNGIDVIVITAEND